MTAFDEAWEIVKMGYAGMPLDETSTYYDTIREKLGLGEPFDTGYQRRVFNILDQPNFVAKVTNSEGKANDSPYEFGRDDEGNPPSEATNSGMFEDYAYPSLAQHIPNTAERFLLPAETMGLEENISHVVRQPRVKTHPGLPSKEWETKSDGFIDDFMESARSEVSGRDFEQELMDQIKEFIYEQDFGPGNFSDDMKLLDYYYPYSKPGRVFRR